MTGEEEQEVSYIISDHKVCSELYRRTPEESGTSWYVFDVRKDTFVSIKEDSELEELERIFIRNKKQESISPEDLLNQYIQAGDSDVDMEQLYHMDPIVQQCAKRCAALGFSVQKFLCMTLKLNVEAKRKLISRCSEKTGFGLSFLLESDTDEDRG